MTTKEVADKLVQMCRDGKVEEAKQELFTEDTISILNQQTESCLKKPGA